MATKKLIQVERYRDGGTTSYEGERSFLISAHTRLLFLGSNANKMTMPVTDVSVLEECRLILQNSYTDSEFYTTAIEQGIEDITVLIDHFNKEYTEWRTNTAK